MDPVSGLGTPHASGQPEREGKGGEGEQDVGFSGGKEEDLLPERRSGQLCRIPWRGHMEDRELDAGCGFDKSCFRGGREWK